MKLSEIVETILKPFPKEYKLKLYEKRAIIRYVIDEYINTLESEINKKNEFILKGLGKFYTTDVKVGGNTNPFTGLPVRPCIRTRLRFRACNRMKRILKQIK